MYTNLYALVNCVETSVINKQDHVAQIHSVYFEPNLAQKTKYFRSNEAIFKQVW